MSKPIYVPSCWNPIDVGKISLRPPISKIFYTFTELMYIFRYLICMREDILNSCLYLFACACACTCVLDLKHPSTHLNVIIVIQFHNTRGLVTHRHLQVWVWMYIKICFFFDFVQWNTISQDFVSCWHQKKKSRTRLTHWGPVTHICVTKITIIG